MCAASTPFDQLSPSLTTLPIPPFRRLTDSPVTGPVSPQVTNYDFRLNLDAFSNEETAVGGGRSYKSSTLHSWMTCSANIHRHHQCHHHHHHHCHRHRQQHFTIGWFTITITIIFMKSIHSQKTMLSKEEIYLLGEASLMDPSLHRLIEGNFKQLWRFTNMRRRPIIYIRCKSMPSFTVTSFIIIQRTDSNQICGEKTQEGGFFNCNLDNNCIG